MQIIKNNALNELLFFHKDIDIIDSTFILFKQLGSSLVRTVDVVVIDVDCFTVSYEFTLTENQMPNATYLIDIVDSVGDVLFTSTVRVIDNNDIQRAYIVDEYNAIILPIIENTPTDLLLTEEDI